MNDLISRSALLGEIAHGKNKPEKYDGAQEADWIEHCISTAPVVDAQPVRHGKWQFAFMDDLFGETYCCSCCNEIGYPEAKFCPNCGAKMDLE